LQLLSADAIVQVHRIHFTEHLPCFNGIADMHIQAFDAPGNGGADFVSKARLHCPYTS
jgi:hypothetical protein